MKNNKHYKILTNSHLACCFFRLRKPLDSLKEYINTCNYSFSEISYNDLSNDIENLAYLMNQNVCPINLKDKVKLF